MTEDIETINKPIGMRRDEHEGQIKIIAVTYDKRPNPNNQPGFMNVPVDHLVYEGTDRIEAARIEARVSQRTYEPNPL